MARQSILVTIIVIGWIQLQQQVSVVHSFGDVFSGITGQAPESLAFPPSTLDGTNIDPANSSVDLQCIYKASRDGWSAIDFHESVDSRGSALVVCLSKSGKKFGGYCPTVRFRFLHYIHGDSKYTHAYNVYKVFVGAFHIHQHFVLTFRNNCRHPSFRALHKQGWMSTDDYVSSNAAFLWSQKGNDVIKCPVLQGGNAALFDYASAGPVFGAVGDLLCL
jgi:hypothetical protein